jgi:hypothetical protein
MPVSLFGPRSFVAVSTSMEPEAKIIVVSLFSRRNDPSSLIGRIRSALADEGGFLQ